MTYATIDGFESLTDQEVFDISAKHLLKQGEKSLDVNRSDLCMYRGPSELQCAAGPFLKDKQAKKCETMGWRELTNKGMVPDRHSILVTRLQHVHDIYEPGDWVQVLAVIAQDFGLEFSP